MSPVYLRLFFWHFCFDKHHGARPNFGEPATAKLGVGVMHRMLQAQSCWRRVGIMIRDFHKHRHNDNLHVAPSFFGSAIRACHLGFPVNIELGVCACDEALRFEAC